MYASGLIGGLDDGLFLPPGTCLHARPDGPLVCVLLAPQHDGRRARRGWGRWTWTGAWGEVPLYARATADDRFETCPGTVPPES